MGAEPSLPFEKFSNSPGEGLPGFVAGQRLSGDLRVRPVVFSVAHDLAGRSKTRYVGVMRTAQGHPKNN